MNRLVIGLMAAFLVAAPCQAHDWTVVSVTTAPPPEPFAYKRAEAVWLHVTLRNDSKVINYLRGLWGKWFMVDAFVRRHKTGTWELESGWVDQKLEWIAVKPGESIQITRHVPKSDIGLPMMLTFNRSFSEGDHTGSIILLDPFTIPGPEEPSNEAKK